ncbi:MAG: VOC family protein [Planctomycetes bacterium]|nr:VOC family protein [Planctomycetota bacterium]MBI3833349.1 VOC family protein [Planctomycetota bacterium]
MGDSNIGAISWHDLTVPDGAKIRDFYAAVVGWKIGNVDLGGYDDFTMLAPESGEIVAGVCHARGAIADIPPQWLMYVAVTEVDASATECKSLRGRILVGPKPIGNDRFCVIRDPAGAVFALCTRKSAI